MARTFRRFSIYQRHVESPKILPNERNGLFALIRVRSAPQRTQQWLDSASVKRVLPKGPMGQALGYLRNQWSALQVYLTDGRILSNCETMVQDGAYRNAWIGKLDGSMCMVDHWQMGMNGEDAALTHACHEGQWSEVGQQLLAQNRIAIVPHAACLTADFSPAGETPRNILAARLEYRERVFGLLIAEPTVEVIDHKEQTLFQELAGDLGLAMYSLEVEQQRQQAEQPVPFHHPFGHPTGIDDEAASSRDVQLERDASSGGR